MNRGLCANLVVVVILSVICNYVAYFGFTSNYTHNAFSLESFGRQYDQGIYRYRVVSNVMIKAIDGYLQRRVTVDTEPRLIQLDAQATGVFYLSYFILNTVFLALTAVMLVLLLHLRLFAHVSPGEKQYMIFLVPVLLAMTQYVVTPYDLSSYFAELLILYFFLRFYDRRFIVSLVLIGIGIFLAALNRESAAIALAFVVLMTGVKTGFTRRSMILMTVAVGSFMAAYIALRLLMPGSARVAEDMRLMNNLTYYPNLLGILTWLVLFFLTMKTAITAENRWLIIAFHIACIPYIAVCILTGILFEIRLYMPLLLASMIIAKLDVSGFRYRLGSLPGRIAQRNRFRKQA